MNKLAHIINPVHLSRPSDLEIAQPITFETMRAAKNFARDHVDIDLYAVQLCGEPVISLPACFIKIPCLERSVYDLKAFHQKRTYPLIKDILSALNSASQADYLIYTNVDIAVQPYFYLVVSKLIDSNYDAFVINRRSVSDTYSRIDDIPLMCSEVGKKHPGFDCFVFHRRFLEDMVLGDVCIGITKIGVTLLTNLICLASRFRLFEDRHLTFHIGERMDWQDSQLKDYVEHNEQEALRVLRRLKSTYPQKFTDSPLCMKHFNMLWEKLIERRKAD